MATPQQIPRRETGERSIGELLRTLSDEVSRLIRHEIRLAKVEMTERAKLLGKAAAYFGVAAVAGLLFLGSLTAMAILLLSLVMDAWLAALIVTGAWLVVALIFSAVGMSAYRRATPPVPEKTIQTVRDDIQWAERQRTSSGT